MPLPGAALSGVSPTCTADGGVRGLPTAGSAAGAADVGDMLGRGDAGPGAGPAPAARCGAAP